MRRVLLALGVVFALTTVLIPGEARGETASEAELVNAINRERAARGLPTLIVHRDLVDDARVHAGRMAGAGRIYHNGNLGAVTSGWTKLAENVGRGGSASAVHSAFMSSSSHRVNVLGDYSYLAVGTVRSGGYLYVDVIFMQGAWSATPHYPPFWDDELISFEPDIGALAAHGISKGCAPSQFCPWQSVTRGQMAAFLVRGLGLSGGRDAFRDDNGHQFEKQINALAAAGITVGCAPGRYCPNDLVSRGEMAAFLVRSLGIPRSSRNYFWDDNGNPFEADINALAASGITQGCASGRFCPHDPVRREQMASFLARGLKLR